MSAELRKNRLTFIHAPILAEIVARLKAGEPALAQYLGGKQACFPRTVVGLTPSFRRTLPETGCLSQGLPHGTCCPFVVPPKPLNTHLLPGGHDTASCLSSSSLRGEAARRALPLRGNRVSAAAPHRLLNWRLAMAISKDLLDILVCPLCKATVELKPDQSGLKCVQCHRVYPIREDIPVMLVDEAKIEE